MADSFLEAFKLVGYTFALLLIVGLPLVWLKRATIIKRDM